VAEPLNNEINRLKENINVLESQLLENNNTKNIIEVELNIAKGRLLEIEGIINENNTTNKVGAALKLRTVR
jgi:hypothetical protein